MRSLTQEQKSNMKKAILERMAKRDNVHAGLADILLDRAGDLDRFKHSVKEMIEGMVDRCAEMLESHVPNDGATPARGSEYWTEADIEEMQDEMCERLEPYISGKVANLAQGIAQGMNGLRDEMTALIEANASKEDEEDDDDEEMLDENAVRAIVKKMLPKKVDEDAILRKVNALIPKREKMDVGLALSELIDGKKVVIPQRMVDGLESTLRSMWSQIGNGGGKGYVHGGGDTIRAGNSITLTRNPDGTTTINASGAGYSIETPAGLVNSSNASYAVSAEPVYVVADGITYFDGAGYAYAALGITMDSPPTQYIRSFY